MFKVKKGPPTGKRIRSLEILDGVIFFGKVVGERGEKVTKKMGLFIRDGEWIIRIKDSDDINEGYTVARSLFVEDYMPILQVEM